MAPIDDAARRATRVASFLGVPDTRLRLTYNGGVGVADAERWEAVLLDPGGVPRWGPTRGALLSDVGTALGALLEADLRAARDGYQAEANRLSVEIPA